MAVAAAGSCRPASLAACLERERQRLLRLRDCREPRRSTEGPRLSAVYLLFCVAPVCGPATAGREFDNQISAERFGGLLLCVDHTASLLRSRDCLRLVRVDVSAVESSAPADYAPSSQLQKVVTSVGSQAVRLLLAADCISSTHLATAWKGLEQMVLDEQDDREIKSATPVDGDASAEPISSAIADAVVSSAAGLHPALSRVPSLRSVASSPSSLATSESVWTRRSKPRADGLCTWLLDIAKRQAEEATHALSGLPRVPSSAAAPLSNPRSPRLSSSSSSPRSSRMTHALVHLSGCKLVPVDQVLTPPQTPTHGSFYRPDGVASACSIGGSAPLPKCGPSGSFNRPDGVAAAGSIGGSAPLPECGPSRRSLQDSPFAVLSSLVQSESNRFLLRDSRNSDEYIITSSQSQEQQLNSMISVPVDIPLSGPMPLLPEDSLISSRDVRSPMSTFRQIPFLGPIDTKLSPVMTYVSPMASAAKLELLAHLLSLGGQTLAAERAFMSAVLMVQASSSASSSLLDDACDADPLALRCLNAAADCLDDLGRLDEALAIRRRVWAALAVSRGEDSLEAISALVAIGRTQAAASDLQGAAATLRHASGMLDIDPGPEHPDSLACLSLLASVLMKAGELCDALDATTELHRRREALGGKASPDALAALHGVASCLLGLGRPAEAESCWLDALGSIGAANVPDSCPQAMSVIQSLAGQMYGEGRLAEALPLYERLAAARAEAYGAEHPDARDGEKLLRAVKTQLSLG